MNGNGELRVRTCRELDSVVVEIGDNGPGVPAEIQIEDFRSVFHHQERWRRNRPRSGHRGAHRAETSRPHRSEIETGRHPIYGAYCPSNSPRVLSNRSKPPDRRKRSDRSKHERTVVRTLSHIKKVKPHTKGCEECLKMGDTWVHLRLCRECGHVGCCDSSKNKHATKHFHATKHPDHAVHRTR